MGFGDGSGISWTICKQSAPHSRQITTSTPHHSVFTGWMLFLTPNQQCQITEGSFRLVYTISKQTARACQAHGQPNKVLHASMLSQVTGGWAGYILQQHSVHATVQRNATSTFTSNDTNIYLDSDLDVLQLFQLILFIADHSCRCVHQPSIDAGSGRWKTERFRDGDVVQIVGRCRGWSSWHRDNIGHWNFLGDDSVGVPNSVQLDVVNW